MNQRVLVLCTGNSCRSQMAQYLWSALSDGAWECHSAGSKPAGYVHPEAIAALADAGIVAHDARSKSVEEFAGHCFDLVITVCNSAHEACPVFPGAVRQEHWPFDDPADATGSDDEIRAVFHRVRDEIEARIRQFLTDERQQQASLFRGWLSQLLEQYPGSVESSRCEAYEAMIASVAGALERGAPAWPTLPAAIRDGMAEYGWEWNGIYARHAGVLQLVAAAGPPVCATLERGGGVGSSGMCHDVLLTAQPIVAARVDRWPGYVSCDGESGLGTIAGMAVPLRSGAGVIEAVWDLDSTEPLLPEDVFFMERLLASIGPFKPWTGMLQ